MDTQIGLIPALSRTLIMASSLLAATSKSAFSRRLPALAKPLVAARPSSSSSTQSSDALYVPGGPIYKGTVNDPTSFPTPSRTHGSHHWSFERLLSASLIPLTGAAFATSPTAHPVVDGLLGVSLIVHSHIGFDAMLVDYVHPRKFPVIGRIGTWALRATTVGVLVGVYEFNTNDVGLTELISKVWHA
ncbi:Succinate dehydrogenase [ubiquinone] cytochrome b small subunit [Mycena chlorophos]|uniref:Succinate dehydrogenase [ubiquinone] cytochrome b small subunit n=2 Tax=Mycena chlorophos TaxID=658473 RepID=A0A8H6SEW1_MYCCL|nr:Succinate dehydrogenase [ubiquinone] cytochrome b small subunit [Mycena chlorophos]